MTREAFDVFLVRGTKKFRERVEARPGGSACEPSTVLGDWYATVLFSKPHVALFVDERTLLPVLLPFAPAASVIDRFPSTLAATMHAHGVAAEFVADEIAQMSAHRLETTRSRSVIGTMNDFSYLVKAHVRERPSARLTRSLVAAGRYAVRPAAEPTRIPGSRARCTRGRRDARFALTIARIVSNPSAAGNSCVTVCSRPRPPEPSTPGAFARR
jgi:hypothetical protein